jgi:hypothetical protein
MFAIVYYHYQGSSFSKENISKITENKVCCRKSAKLECGWIKKMWKYCHGLFNGKSWNTSQVGKTGMWLNTKKNVEILPSDYGHHLKVQVVYKLLFLLLIFWSVLTFYGINCKNDFPEIYLEVITTKIYVYISIISIIYLDINVDNSK